MPHIILASQSPRRKALLQQIGLPFEIHPSQLEEYTAEEEPSRIVTDLAQLKAHDIASSHSDSLVIGADTMVIYGNEVLGKPNSAAEAEEMLQFLSGKTHDVYTGVALVLTGPNHTIQKELSFYEQTKVTFSTLDLQDIRAYIKTGSPMDKAGAYGIQDDLGALFIETITGDYYNVVGFPLNRFYRELKSFLPALTLFNT